MTKPEILMRRQLGGRSRMWIPRLLVLVILIPRSVPAQLIVGHLVEADTQIAVAGATVILLDENQVDRESIATDSLGRFQFSGLAAGRYALRVSHIGFPSFTSEFFELKLGETLELQIRVGREAIPLDPLLVTARSSDIGRLAGYRRRLASNPFGTFITREEIEKRATAEVTDFLRNIAGVHVIPVKRDNNPNAMTTHLVTMRGRGNEPGILGADLDTRGLCLPAVFLDGIRIEQSANFPIDHVLRPESLEGMEVYATHANVPAQLQSSTACGTLAMWTRQGGGNGRSNWVRNGAGLGILALTVFFLAK